jgi:hypothetical protein
MRRGEPIIVHGDGTSLWTLTHHVDFARGFVPLLAHPRTVGEAFHITSDDAPTWNQIAEALAAAAGTEARIVHVPSDAIAAADPEWGAVCSATRLTRWCSTTPSCVRSCPTTWRRFRSSRAHARSSPGTTQDPARQEVDARLNAVMDRLARDHQVARAR